MKVLSRIFYYSILILIIISASYKLLQKAVLSPLVKRNIIENVGPALNADRFDLESISFGFTGISVKNIVYQKENVKTVFKDFRADFSVWETFINLIKFKGLSLRAESVTVSNCHITVEPETRPSIGDEWEFEFKEFEKIVDFLKDNDYIRSVDIKNLDLTYISDLALPLFRDMNGRAKYTPDDKITLELSGKSLSSESDNIFLKGLIDQNDYTADVELISKSQKPINFRSPFGLYSINNALYSGNAKLEIKKFPDEKFSLSADFKLTNLDAIIDDHIFIKNAGIDLSYYNGMISVKDINGKINGIPFSGNGRLFSMLSPNGDIFIDMIDIKKEQIYRALSAVGSENIVSGIQLGDDNSLRLHLSGDMVDPSVYFDLELGDMVVRNMIINDTECSGIYSSGNLKIKEASILTSGIALNFEGIISDILTKNLNYDINFKGTGALFRNIFFLNSEKIKNYSTIINGNITGQTGTIPKLKAELKAFNFKNMNEKEFVCDIGLEDEDFSVNILDDNLNMVAQGKYSLSDKSYSLQGDDFAGFYDLIYGRNILRDNTIYFSLKGDPENFSVNAGSKNKNSLFYGQLDAKFDLSNPVLESFVNWMPGGTEAVTKPVNFRIRKKNRIIHISNIIFDYGKVSGDITLNLINTAVAGKLDIESIDLGRFFNIRDLSTKTDLSLLLKGSLPEIKTELFINENILKFKGASGDSIQLSGNAHITAKGKNINIGDFNLYSGMNKVLSMTGNISDLLDLQLSTKGNSQADILNAFFKDYKFKGQIDYKADFAGSIKEPRLKNSEINFKDGSVNGDRINNIKVVTTEFDSTGVVIRELKIDAGKYFNLDAEGFLPYKNSEIFLTGNFYGDIIGYVGNKTEFISDASSEIEGKFTIDGKYDDIRIRDLELYILDGQFKPKSAQGAFKNIKSKIVVNERSEVDIIKLVIDAEKSGGKIEISNILNSEKYGDITMQGSLNLGHLLIKTDDKGFNYNLFRMMLPGDYGNFVLKGRYDDFFRIYKKDSKFVTEGKVILKNSHITFPFLKTEDEKSGKVKIVKIHEKLEFLKNVEFDIDLVPDAANSYFYNLDMEEKSVWSRMITSFSRLDAELNNVIVNILPGNKGITLNGQFGKPGSLSIKGKILGRNGSCSYSAFNFKIEDASINFDGKRNIHGKIDPYLQAYGKTTVKTKPDSTGFYGYEDIFIKVVTKENGDILDSEGARISDLSIILIDEYGNMWLEREERLSDIDTRGTMLEIFNEAFDTRVFSPFILPIEYAIGRFIGASISIRPSVSENFIDRELGVLELPDRYAEIFLGSEVYISRFLTDDLAVTWNTEYIGSEEYIEITERDYGYMNRLSLDYRINNYLFSSAGYEYDSIQNEYGYNIALMYRYRFFNISEPYNYIKNFLRIKIK